jgi:hypothetical protein
MITLVLGKKFVLFIIYYNGAESVVTPLRLFNHGVEKRGVK